MGALLDTHALYWFVSGANPLADEAIVAIAEAQAARGLYVSPATAWELGVAARKPTRNDRPHLGDLSPSEWFRQAVAATGARVAPIRQSIALEAAEIVAETGHKDPGDCFLMATARILRVPLITRDRLILQLARERPDYLATIEC